MKLTELEKQRIKGYAEALQALMYSVTGDNTCGKSYDPCDFFDGDEGTLHSYAFNFYDGGRHHALSQFKNVDDILNCMLIESTEYMKEALNQNKQ